MELKGAWPSAALSSSTSPNPFNGIERGKQAPDAGRVRQRGIHSMELKVVNP